MPKSFRLWHAHLSYIQLVTPREQYTKCSLSSFDDAKVRLFQGTTKKQGVTSPDFSSHRIRIPLIILTHNFDKEKPQLCRSQTIVFHQRVITITVITVSRNTFLFLIPELTIYIIYLYIYIVKLHLTFSFPSDTPSVKTVITVIVIAVMEIPQYVIS